MCFRDRCNPLCAKKKLGPDALLNTPFTLVRTDPSVPSDQNKRATCMTPPIAPGEIMLLLYLAREAHEKKSAHQESKNLVKGSKRGLRTAKSKKSQVFSLFLVDGA